MYTKDLHAAAFVQQGKWVVGLDKDMKTQACPRIYCILYYIPYTISYYAILYYTILYYTILYYTILYYTILQYGMI